MGMTNYLEGRLLRHVLTNTPYTPPETIYLGLFTLPPDVDGLNGEEVTAPDYQRIPVTFNVAEGSPSLGDLAETVEFPTASSPWGTVVAGGLFDAQTEGNLLSFDQFTDPSQDGVPLPKEITTGDVLRVVNGNLRVTLGNYPEATATT